MVNIRIFWNQNLKGDRPLPNLIFWPIYDLRWPQEPVSWPITWFLHWFHLRFVTWASTNAVRVRQALWVYTVINSSKFVDRIIQTSCWAWFDRAADPLGWDTKTSFIFGYNLLLILDRHPSVTWSNPAINYRGYNGLQKYQRKSYAILFLAVSANHMIDWFHNIK